MLTLVGRAIYRYVFEGSGIRVYSVSESPGLFAQTNHSSQRSVIRKACAIHVSLNISINLMNLTFLAYH